MQNENKPPQESKENEEFGEDAKTSEITVLIVSPGGQVEVRPLPNTLDAMRVAVDGTITTFETGIAGTIGVANDEAILLGLPPCRYIEATGALIFGTFFLAGDGVSMHSLSVDQIAEGLRQFLPPLTGAQIFEALRRETETVAMIEEWNRERLEAQGPKAQGPKAQGPEPKNGKG